MAFTSRPIPNLFNGISQQPPSLRAPTQAEVQENGYPQIATGLRKRPGTNHVVKLTTVSDTSAKVHFINRDAVERYVVRIRNGVIEVWNLITGAAQTVNTPDGTTYLNSANCIDDFVLLTIADYTFIVNKTKVVAMSASLTPGSISSQKQKFSDLAAGTNSGNIYEISGDPSNTFDNYYVKDQGVYTETVKPGIQFAFDATTMPHVLIRTGPGVFSFQKATWGNRAVGDTVSIPNPSFVGRTINDVCYHRYRLGFLSGESLSFSRAGEYFNFWAQSVTAILDSDPIDISASHAKVSTLRSSASFEKALVVFSDQTQFQLSADSVLTPKNAKLDPVTEFESESAVRPASAGQTLFFVVSKGNYSGMREYYVEPTTLSTDAADVTAHVPRYIPSGVYCITASTNEDFLVVATKTEPNALYTYKYYWSDENKKVQSAWSKWTFGSGKNIMGVFFIGTKLYLAVDMSDGLHLEHIDIQSDPQDGALPFAYHLDRKVSRTGTYDAVNDWTTWTLPYDDSETYQAVLGSQWSSQAGRILTTTRPSGTTIRATGNWTAFPVFLGRVYSMVYTFSQFFIKDDQGISQPSAIIKLLYVSVAFDGTGYLRAEVKPKGRGTFKYPFTGKTLGTVTATIGQLALSQGAFRFPVVADSTEVSISLINDSPLPCRLLSAEWEAEVSSRSK